MLREAKRRGAIELLGGLKKCDLEGPILSVHEYFERATVVVEVIADIRFPSCVRLAFLLRDYACGVDEGGGNHEGSSTVPQYPHLAGRRKGGLARGDGALHCARNLRSQEEANARPSPISLTSPCVYDSIP